MAVLYKVETRTTQNILTEADLTTIGASDWELVGIIQSGMTVIYIFKK